MHIFMVNDDGISAPGILALARAASAGGHTVTLCAPASQQSATSQRITLFEPIYVSPYPIDVSGVTAFSISGTPADCVRVGLSSLITRPVDIVISGINNGYNAGMAVHYSGTVGAAREGALNHLHAVAASIGYHATPEALAHFAAYVIKTAETYREMDVPPVTVLNINAPAIAPQDFRPAVFAPLSCANYLDSYLRRESPRSGVYYWMESGARTEDPAEGTDQDLLEKGHMTLTLMGNPSHVEGDAAGGAFAALLR